MKLSSTNQKPGPGIERPTVDGDEAAANRGPTSLLSRSVWLLLGITYVVATVSRIANTWDGSYVLFRVLNDGAPFIPHGRYVDALTAWPTVLASRLTGNVGFAQTVFSAIYAAIPLLVLALSWWIVQSGHRRFFPWVVLGTTLAMLPGAINITAEANLAALLAWPLMLGALLGVDRPRLVVLALLGAVLVWTHPLGIVLLAFAGGVAVLSGLRHRDRRRLFLWLAAMFGGFACLSLVRFLLTKSPYESDQISVTTVRVHFSTAVSGAPLLVLLLTLAIAAIVLTMPFNRFVSRTRVRGIDGDSALIILAAVLITLIGGVWASHLRSWGGAIDYRTYVGIAAVVVMLFAVADALFQTGRHEPDGAAQTVRSVAACAAAAAFAIVFSIQCLTWRDANLRLHDDLARGAGSCLPISALPWAAETALGHWSVTPLTLMQQGRAPRRVIVTAASCDAANLATGIPVGTFYRQSLAGGWFNLQGILAGARTTARPAP